MEYFLPSGNPFLCQSVCGNSYYLSLVVARSGHQEQQDGGRSVADPLNSLSTLVAFPSTPFGPHKALPAAPPPPYRLYLPFCTLNGQRTNRFMRAKLKAKIECGAYILSRGLIMLTIIWLVPYIFV
jgi:hypothetical protein